MTTRWEPIVRRAAEIVRSYDTGVTLRQLFYRLVAEGTIPNTPSAYKSLSRKTSDARHDGTFPRLIDRTRYVHRPVHYDGPGDALRVIADGYRRDRTEGQGIGIYVGCEKDALSALLETWLDPSGIPVLVFKGWSSTSYIQDIADVLDDEGRKTVLLYLGDLDPAGEGIEAKIEELVGFDEVSRVALTVDQARGLNLPENVGILCARPEPTTRCCKLHHTPGRIPFIETYGRLFQIEVDALPPNVLQSMVLDAVESVMELSRYEDVLAREEVERESLSSIAEAMR
ncbi:MAG: hypothetical protein ABWY83_06390 [Actinomycetota bacterium]